MRVDSRQWPVREECLLTAYTHYWKYSKSLEGDCGRDESDGAAFYIGGGSSPVGFGRTNCRYCPEHVHFQA